MNKPTQQEIKYQKLQQQLKEKYVSFHLFMPEKEYFKIKKMAKKQQISMSKLVRNIFDECWLIIASKVLLQSQHSTSKKHVISKSFVSNEAQAFIRQWQKNNHKKEKNKIPELQSFMYKKRRVSLKKEARYCIKRYQYDLLCEYEFINKTGSKAEMLRDVIINFLKLLSWFGPQEYKTQIKKIKDRAVRIISILAQKNNLIHKKVNNRVYKFTFDFNCVHEKNNKTTILIM